jgi:hypothetical protein
VHVETSDPRVRLYRIPNRDELDMLPRDELGSSYWRWGIPVCVAPCDQVVDGRAGQRFKFDGTGLSPSAPFKLNELGGDVTFDVQPGPNGSRVAGIALTAVGATVPIFASPLMTLGALERQPNVFTVAGIGVMTAGFGLLAAGIALYVTSQTAVKMRWPPIVPFGRGARLERGVVRF